jgi:hypothetical protein
LERYHRGDSFWGLNYALDIIENFDLKKPSFWSSKWPRKLKPAKNSKLPKLLENCFEPVEKGGWPPISTWITFSNPFSQVIYTDYTSMASHLWDHKFGVILNLHISLFTMRRPPYISLERPNHLKYIWDKLRILLLQLRIFPKIMT